jgi:hypothetical protein
MASIDYEVKKSKVRGQIRHRNILSVHSRKPLIDKLGTLLHINPVDFEVKKSRSNVMLDIPTNTLTSQYIKKKLLSIIDDPILFCNLKVKCQGPNWHRSILCAKYFENPLIDRH